MQSQSSEITTVETITTCKDKVNLAELRWMILAVSSDQIDHPPSSGQKRWEIWQHAPDTALTADCWPVYSPPSAWCPALGSSWSRSTLSTEVWPWSSVIIQSILFIFQTLLISSNLLWSWVLSSSELPVLSFAVSSRLLWGDSILHLHSTKLELGPVCHCVNIYFAIIKLFGECLNTQPIIILVSA